MFDSNLPSDPILDWSRSAPANADLDQRLGLYRVFLKLYEHHRELLNEILDLETVDTRSKAKSVWQYVQGVVQGGQAYLITNLIQDKTQLLMHPQKIWVIGRDRKAGILIPDQRLSRRHAIIRHVQEGFYLTDLNSTNGTYVNGKPISRPTRLKDGDRVRLGSLSFVFFLCNGVRMLDAASPDIANPTTMADTNTPLISQEDDDQEEESSLTWHGVISVNEKETSTFLRPKPPKTPVQDDYNLSADQKSDILDRFLNR